MPCSLKFLLPVMILAIPVAALAQSKPRTYPNLGTPLNQADIQNFDRMIGPEGTELPPGAEPQRKARRSSPSAARYATGRGGRMKTGSSGVS
jgi:hypothetical protein